MVPAPLAPADEVGPSAEDEALARELFGDESPEAAESDGGRSVQAGPDGDHPVGRVRARRPSDMQLEDMLQGEAPPEVVEGTVKVMRRPREPTAEERAEHERLHEPYRDWCPACVAGRGRVEPHLTRDHGADAVPVLGFDYGYLSQRRPPVAEGQVAEEWIDEPETSEEGQAASPLLCGRSRTDKWLVGLPLPCKGTGHPYCEAALVAELRRAGRWKMFVRSDREPAIRSLINAACATVTRVYGIEAAPEPVRVGDSDANGLAEVAVKEVKAKARSIKFALEKLLG